MPVSPKSMHRIFRYIAFALIFNMSSIAQAASCEKSWAAWDTFKQNLIDKDSRVIDGSSDAMKTTSEGQTYALFFSLVANDQATFDKLLNWSENNLAKGDLTASLPSWELGKKEDASLSVLDENSASDADLWMAYTLGEAGRLWGERRYIALSSLLASRILANETLNVPGLGLVLLPGATGFTPTPTTVRLNPSYLPMQLLRWFTAHSNDPRWTSLLKSSLQVIVKSAPNGYAPDWTIYDYSSEFMPDSDPKTSDIGSYDAIRVYLWAGMLNQDDENRRVLLDALKPMAQFVGQKGAPPESINTVTGAATTYGPIGFSAAMIPFLQASDMKNATEEQLSRIEAHPAAQNSYYDQVLSMFALGWHDNLYRFDSNGNLVPRWMSTCP